MHHLVHQDLNYGNIRGKFFPSPSIFSRNYIYLMLFINQSIIEEESNNEKSIYHIRHFINSRYICRCFYLQVVRPGTAELPEDVVMETAFGEEFTFAEMPKKARLIEFMYTNCPDVCP